MCVRQQSRQNPWPQSKWMSEVVGNWKQTVHSKTIEFPLLLPQLRRCWERSAKMWFFWKIWELILLEILNYLPHLKTVLNRSNSRPSLSLHPIHANEGAILPMKGPNLDGHWFVEAMCPTIRPPPSPKGHPPGYGQGRYIPHILGRRGWSQVPVGQKYCLHQCHNSPLKIWNISVFFCEYLWLIMSNLFYYSFKISNQNLHCQFLSKNRKRRRQLTLKYFIYLNEEKDVFYKLIN